MMPMCKTLLLAAAFTCSAVAAAHAVADGPCEREMAQAARRIGIPLGVLYAVGLTETGVRGSLSPYSINADGRALAATSLRDALANFESARSRGAKFIDVGCMQINHHYHGKHFASVAEMFDPAKNVQYAARFLMELKARQRTWTLAVARYNAGPDNTPAQKHYVCRMLKNMVASGFASWTRNARDFCVTEANGNRSP
jgi:soluble lytic murein transglycosylase-like protein